MREVVQKVDPPVRILARQPGRDQAVSMSLRNVHPVWGMVTMSGASPRVTLSQGNRDSAVIEIE